MRKLTYHIETESALSTYCFEFILDILGLVGEKLDPAAGGRRVDIYYGNSPREMEYSILIPARPADRLWSALLSGVMPPTCEARELEFDVVSAIAAFLTDEVNRDLGSEAYDDHGRLKYDCCFQHRSGIGAVPIVNVYVCFLGSVIERKTGLLGMPLWPDGKKCAIGLSHDIDVPQKYAFLTNFRISKALSRRYAYRWLGMLARFIVDRRRDEYWTFPHIIEEENRRGFTSTMFFAATNAFGDWGTLTDIAYSIDSPRLRQLFSQLVENGFEIGLHAGYDTYLGQDRFEWEKNRLSELAGTDVVGLRHHYWHLGNDVDRTLLMHSQAGFLYDSSIAFNDQMGFRRNVALPYYPWIDRIGRRVDCVQLPMFCMDGNLFYKDIEADDAVCQIAEHVSAIKNFSGIGVIDWHERTSYPGAARTRSKHLSYLGSRLGLSDVSWTAPKWGETYLRILDLLASDSEIWASSLGNIRQWLDERRRRIRSAALGT